MKKIICSTWKLLIPLFLQTWCFAQNTNPVDLLLTSEDSTNGKIVPRRMIALRDGGFLLAGNYDVQGYLLRISSCGQTLWARQYPYGDNMYLNSAIELPSGAIVAVGSCENCAPGDSSFKALLLKTSADGQILRDTLLGHAGLNAFGNDLILTANQKIALTGQAIHTNTNALSDAFLTVVDEQFEPDFWKEFHALPYDIGNALVQTADGGFAIAGWGLGASVRAQVFRTDATGNLLWKYTSPYANSVFNDMVQAHDGRLIALGDREVDSLVKREVFLAEFDEATGSLNTEKTYGSAAVDNGKSIALLDQGYMVSGIYGEPRDSFWNRRDWVFLLDEQFTVKDEYFRDDYLFAHGMVNALPLSADGSMFAYYSRVVFSPVYNFHFFKRRFPGAKTVFETSPEHFQLLPRDLITNKGTVPIKGALSDPNAYDQLRLDVLRDGLLQQTLYDNTPQDFAFEPQITAELAGYDFQLYGIKNQSANLELEVCDVVAGDAYLIQGQSNALAQVSFGITEHAYKYNKVPFARTFGLKFDNDTLYTWRKEAGMLEPYADNISGQWGIVLANDLVEKLGVPVAILNGGIGGIFIETMLPNPNNHADTARVYGKFLQRVQRSGLIDHLRGIFMFQGESNALSQNPNVGPDYFQKFETLDNAWRADFPTLERRYLFQIRPGWFNFGATLHSCLQIEEAHRQIAETLPGWQIMSSTGMNHDGLHYHYANGYERAGHDIYRLVAHDLYSVSNTENIYPPTVDALRFSNCDRKEITLQLRQEADSYFWTPGWESDFWLEGDTAITVVGGAIQGNTVVLQLSTEPGAGFTGLSYRSHPEGSEAPVKNANGIGMLTFYNFPVNAYPTPQTADTVRLCSGQTYTLADGTVVSQSGDYDVLLTSAVGCDSLVALRVAIFDPIELQDVLIIPDTGMGTGAITVTPQGGFPDYSFLWNTGEMSATADGLSPGTYTVTVTDALGCSEVFELQMIVGTSQAGFSLAVNLFPNPGGAYVFLHAPGLSGYSEYRIRVTDMLGKTALPPVQPSGGMTRIETGSLPPGTYTFRLLKNGKLVWSGLFVKS
ncbi:MAG: T9SS type A sorting domain-containing protein [Lewinellaceae bacterium]|nr:T9SS type A sorting domain-containing protein [Saprospiraceae bacterium]MCB9333542.1 T9SS type A sorting domain-containing protein [Lewinellaceae bacterium]